MDLELMGGSQVPADLGRLQRVGGHQDLEGMEHYPKDLGHLAQEGSLGQEENLDPEEASLEVGGKACYQSLVQP